jgi:hypothetical protein
MKIGISISIPRPTVINSEEGEIPANALYDSLASLLTDSLGSILESTGE